MPVLSLGPAIALLSSLVWGTSDFCGGLASKRANSLHVVAISQVCGLVPILVLAVISGSFSAPLSYLPWAVTASIAGASGLVAFYAALARGRMGVVAPIASLGVLVPFCAGLATGDRPATWQLAGVVAAVLGVALAGGPELTSAGGRLPIVLAALSALGFGLALTGLAIGGRTSPVMTVVAMRATSVAIFAVVLSRVGLQGRPRGRGLVLTMVAGVGDAGANLLFSWACTMGLLSLTGVLGSLYPVATVVLARYVLQERLRGVQQLGVVAALAGVVLIAAPN